MRVKKADKDRKTAEIVRLRHRDYLTFAEIAEAVNLTRHTVSQWYREYMVENPAPNVDEWRGMTNARVGEKQKLLMATGARATAAGELGVAVRAFNAAAQLDLKLAELNGVAAPTKVDVTVTSNDLLGKVEAYLSGIDDGATADR